MLNSNREHKESTSSTQHIQRTLPPLINYVSSVERLNFKQLQTLKHAVMHKSRPIQSAVKLDATSSQRSLSHNGKRQVSFCDFVIEKEREDIYLTKLNDIESLQTWKYKTIIDKTVMGKLSSNIDFIIDKQKSISMVPLSCESFCSISHLPGFLGKNQQITSKRQKPKSIHEIFRDRVLILVDQQENWYEQVGFSILNSYLNGIFAYLNSQRDLLRKKVVPISQNSYELHLYNEQDQEQVLIVNDLFQQQEGRLLRCCSPMCCWNSKLEFWNCLLDKHFTQRTKIKNNHYDTAWFLRRLIGVPSIIFSLEQTDQLQLLLQTHCNSQNIIYFQNQRGSYFVQSLKSWVIDDQTYLVIILFTFDSNLNFNIKYNPIYQKCTFVQKMLIEKMLTQHRMVMLYEDIVPAIKKIGIAKYYSDLVMRHHLLTLGEVLVLKSNGNQTIIIQIQNQADQQNPIQRFFKVKKTGIQEEWQSDKPVLIEKLSRGVYQLEAGGKIKVAVFSGSNLEIYWRCKV